MLRAWLNFTRFVGSYSHYRKIGLSAHEARHLASMTLPER